MTSMFFDSFQKATILRRRRESQKSERMSRGPARAAATLFGISCRCRKINPTGCLFCALYSNQRRRSKLPVLSSEWLRRMTDAIWFLLLLFEQWKLRSPLAILRPGRVALHGMSLDWLIGLVLETAMCNRQALSVC